MYHSLLCIPCLLLAIASCGCTSMQSTMFTRDESNQTWIRLPHLDGVPITLKVPTHLNVYVFERHFLIKDKVGGIVTVQRLKLPFVLRDFHHDFVYTEKIFTVDYKRPAAGLFNLRLDMTDDQYFDKVQHDVTDQTIEQVTNIVRAFTPETGGIASVLPAGLDSANITGRLEEIESVVAVGMFEIEDPEFEMKLTSFLNCHLNQSHDAFTVPNHVDDIKRSPLPEFRDDFDLCNGGIPTDSIERTSTFPQGNIQLKSEEVQAPEPYPFDAGP